MGPGYVEYADYDLKRQIKKWVAINTLAAQYMRYYFDEMRRWG